MLERGLAFKQSPGNPEIKIVTREVEKEEYASKSDIKTIHTAYIVATYLQKVKNGKKIATDFKFTTHCNCKGAKIRGKCWHTEDIYNNFKENVNKKMNRDFL